MQVLIRYTLTILIETAVLMAALSSRHRWRRRLFAGVWLTSCTYPIVALVLPFFFPPAQARMTYLLVAETFAPAAECLLFWAVFDRPERCPRAALGQDFGATIVANLASFGGGELLNRWVAG